MAIIKVTNTADSGKGSLRAALDSVQAGDTIQFDSSLANKTITLTSGELAITKDITIDGAGAENLTISGNNATRVFSVSSYVNATVKNLTLTNGMVTGKDGRGGAIAAWDYSNLQVENCNFNNNSAWQNGAIYVGYGSKATVLGSNFDSNDGTLGDSGFSGGAIGTYGSGVLVVKDCEFTNNKGVNGGAIYNLLGEATVENSVFLNNSAIGDVGGGGFFCDGGNSTGPGSTVGGTIAIRGCQFENNYTKGEGAGIFSWGYGPDKMIIENSSIVGNTADFNDNGIGRGGGLRIHGDLTMNNVTVANNKAAKQGGGLWLDGSMPANITNSTFSGNKATEDAGGAMFLGTDESVPINIVNSTIVNNEAGRANGAFWFYSPKQPVTLTNSIVAYNTASDFSQKQVGYQLKDGGGNIEYPGPEMGNKVVAGSQVVDPLLGPLENIGGFLIHPLLPGSPAINTGVTVSGVPTTDQLGSERDSKPDIGAFEVVVTPSPQSTPEDTLVMGVTYSAPDQQNSNTQNNTTNNVESSDVLNGSNNNHQLVGYKAKDVLTGNYSHNQPTPVTDSNELLNQFMPAKGNTTQNFDSPKNGVDLRTILSQSKLSGSNLFQEYIKSEPKGSGTSLSVNPEGYFNLNQFQDLFTLDDVTVSSQTDKNSLGK
ncbi:right-handed parallel beta-helix repeat-containing protein [Fischerella sp. JS2]|uniref:right-handed parallel beta-helix repeat-containing protein n=1 Tax=Fischerella sp. JS2 TaxID=2597771 RepID=UPI0028EED7FD|nr:right-handed parallel beta-helix repeat-containing protein [Fischerella sp. JS2]